MKKELLTKQEGVSLYITIMILGIVFSIGFSVSGLLLGEVKIARNISNFVPAIYSADVGIERALYKVRREGVFSPGSCPDSSACVVSGSISSNGTSYSATILDDGVGTCTATNQCIKSVGSKEDTNRAFEVKY